MSRPVTVAIFHAEPIPSDGPLGHAVAAARLALAEQHRAAFTAAGATDVRLVTGRSDDRTPYGERLETVIRILRPNTGLVALGSGAIPLATPRDVRELVATAAGEQPRALTNNRYSADVVAIADARTVLDPAPDLASDNALPRWLEARGVPVEDHRRRWRLGVDIDGPLDLVLLGGRWQAMLPAGQSDRVTARLARLRDIAADASAEIVVAGRTSADAVHWLERAITARTRVLIEERGMRTAPSLQGQPWSILGALLDLRGPDEFAHELALLGDAALVDTRVLIAHRHGRDEGGWPRAEDRFASDLLWTEAIADPWLRDLTASAMYASMPIVLGGHTLVGPGVRLALRAGHA